MPNTGHKPLVPFDPDREHNERHPIASAMRRKGFVPLPRLWVRAEDMAEIYAITERYRDEVMRTRAEVQAQTGANTPPAATFDPVANKDDAWAAYERARQAS